MPPAPTVFISYSHKDEVWKDRLLPHLRISQKEGLLEIWDDRRIGAGANWRSEIQKAIETADIGILLISAHFLVSDFIHDEEIPRLLEQRSKNGMRLFPVLVRACDWQIVPWLEPIQIRPTGARPLAGFGGNRRDEEMAAIAREVRESLVSKAAASSVPESILRPLHQLPTPPADFTGREEDLEFLRSRLVEGGTGAIFGLRGMGGVGKTTLALKLAEELKPRFPDAQIYLDLKGVDPQPLTAAQAMTHVIRSFHPEARLPESEAGLAGLYRSELHGKRALLLMDNAANREQIEPLIPPPTCLLLVTSRFRFALPGLVERDLDEMPEKDARDLLLRIALRIGNNADEIAGLCGRLPLALRLAGSALAERPDLSPAEYIRLFREGKEKLEPVEASLQTSYDLLTEGRQRLWRLLSVFSNTFNAEAVAEVWGLENDDASADLGELVRCSLVDWEGKEERYRLHDLARKFGKGQIGATEQEAARMRLAEHFLEILRTAELLYKKGGEESLLGLSLFDIEWNNIREAQTWAAEHFQEDTEIAKICSNFPAAGPDCLDLRLNPTEIIRWIEDALRAARKLNDRRTEGVHLTHLGLAYSDLGNPHRAIEYYEKALNIDRELKDRKGEGVDLGALGNAYADLGKTRRAIKFYEQRLAIAQEIHDRWGEGTALGNLGLAFADLGETHRAIEFFERRLAIARELHDRRGEGNALGNLGHAFADLGDAHRAIEFHEKHLAISQELEDRRGESSAFGNLGLAYAILGETRRAIKFHEQHLNLARELEDRQGEANALWNLGTVYEKEGNIFRAAELMQTRVDYEREIGHSDAEKHAARVAALRARIAEQES